jgi:hypothetical protein
MSINSRNLIPENLAVKGFVLKLHKNNENLS